MSVLVKIIHTAVAENKDPIVAIKRRLLNYRNTTHPSTGKTPAEVMFGRTIRTRIPIENVTENLSSAVKDAKKKDEETRERRKVEFDKKNKTKVKQIKVGDKVLVKQNKTVLNPPFDPKPYEVDEVKNTRVSLKRGNRKN